MTNEGRVPAPEYLFHWLPSDRLDRMVSRREVRPAWTHYLLDQERFAKGTSTCEEPMLWNPDEELPREPCIVLERSRIASPVWHVKSSECYHLTRKVRLAARSGEDLAPILESARAVRAFSHGGWDEFFVEGGIPISAVVGIGFEEGESADRGTAAAAERTAERLGVPLIDMTGWAVGSPDPDEVNRIVGELRDEARQKMGA